MSERRFTDEEVAEIFQRATESQHTLKRQLSSGDGMTLTQLQEIGREVGIPADLVAQAAHSLDVSGRPVERRLLGLPIGVGRTVELPRRLTDEEWERLVVDLRETFDARGSVRSQGGLRQWTNGNLQALLEPTESGHRLRLKTMKGDARGLMLGGLAILGGGVVMFVAGALEAGGATSGVLASLSSLAMIGAGMFGIGAIRLPSWARTRRKQMEDVAARAAQLADRPTELPRSSR